MYANSAEQDRNARVQTLADRLYREHWHHPIRIALKNAANREDAEEAVSEAFASFIRAFDPDDDAPPLAWLILTLKRACWDRYRRRRIDGTAGQETDRPSGESGSCIDSIPSRTSATEQLVAEVDEARARLATLKPAERTAISLKAVGFSYGEIAEYQGWTHTKVDRCLAEGRAALRRGRRAE